LRELLPELVQLGPNDHPAIGLAAIVFIITMMVVFCPVKGHQSIYFRDDRPFEFSACIQFIDKLFRSGFLFIIAVKDNGTVLLTEVVALLVERGGIMYVEKYIKQVAIANDGRVILNFIHFGMARCSAADLLIGWFFDITPRVARRHLEDAFQPGKDGLSAPETAAAQYRHFDSISHVHRV